MSLIEKIAEQLKGISDTPLLDARFFCAYYQNKPSEAKIADFVQRRSAGEPVSKIIRQKGFWKRDFYVSNFVLDPRPDSETVIEAVKDCFPDVTKAYRALDIGTGSGCLILSLCDEYRQLQGIGIDVSTEALAVARQNDAENKIVFKEKNFYIDDFGDLGQFDILISNPPYIPTADIEKLEKSVRLFDPLVALDGGKDGLNAYRRLSHILKKCCHSKSMVFFEIGQGQAEAVRTVMHNENWRFVKSYRDLGGITRVLVFSL